MTTIDVAEANQLLAAAETRLAYLAGITPSEERQLALEATVRAQFKLRTFLGIVPCGVPDCEFERARHDHEEDERDPEWVKHIDEDGARFHVIAWTTAGRQCSEPRCEINRPEDEREDWSPRSRYFDDEYNREPVVHRDDSQGYRDAMIDAGRGELLRG